MWLRLLVIIALCIHFTQLNLGVLSVADAQIERLDSPFASKAFQSLLKELGIVHPLIPRTRKELLIPCRNIMDYHKVVREALACTNEQVYPEDPIKSFVLPECYIIPTTSPDVIKDPSGQFNFITLGIDLSFKILGFYEDQTNTIFVVQSFDQVLTTKHEIQHAVLHQREGDGDARHVHQIWERCQPGYYDPSQAAIDAAKED